MKISIKSAAVITAGIALTAFLAFYIPKSMQVGGKDIYVPKSNAVNEKGQLNDEEIPAGPQLPENDIQMAVQPEVSGVESQLTDTAQQQNDQQAEQTPENQTEQQHEQQSFTEMDINVEEQNVEKDNGSNDANDGVRKYSRAWAEKKMEEHKDEIEPGDLENFKYIIGKLGEEKIASFFSGGLTQQEQGELYNYMKDTLTESEYEDAKMLFAKYNWILFEE